MTAEAIPVSKTSAAIHPLWVRVSHWINAVAILVMIGSGWQIYDASPLPLFNFTFPTTIARLRRAGSPRASHGTSPGCGSSSPTASSM